MKTIELHIVDIVHNSIRAGAKSICIEVKNSANTDMFSLKITDDAGGIESEKLKAINENFYSSRKERKIGMGLALLKYHSEIAGGEFYIKSELTKGTVVFASFQKSNIDMQPIGDLSETFATFICQYSKINFIIAYISDTIEFEFSTDEIIEVFEGIELNNHKIITAVKDLIESNINLR